MRSVILFLLGCCTLVSAFTTEDPYHQTLRTQLNLDYGIQGGNWVLSDSEQKTNTNVSPTRVTVEVGSASDSLSFSQTVSVTVPARAENSWENAIRIPSGSAIQSGDALLLVIWINTVESDESNINNISFKFEPTAPPWIQSLNFPAKIKKGWRQWMIPFESKNDFGSDQSRFQMDLGHMAGVIQVGGIALLNFGKLYRLEELPFSEHHLDYEGRETNAPWRIEALARIEKFRKGALNLKVLNQNGFPISNTVVTAKMKEHEFGFGTAIATRWWYRNTTDADTYLNKLSDLTGDGRTFNIAVFENALKWPAWENTWATTPSQNVEVLSWLKSQGMKVRGHNLVWPKWNHLPNDLESNQSNPEYIQNRIKTHISEVAGFEGIKGIIDEWDVINEMVHCKDLADLFGTENIYSDWLQWAFEVDSNALLYLNEYSIISGGGNDINSRNKYKDVIQLILDQGSPLHGIGIQGHMGSSLTPPTKILEIFDDFTQFDLDISLTEYDAKGLKGDIQYDYMRDMLITCFSHPQVKNFLMWGFWDGAHWHNDAPLFEEDWTLKPSGRAFLDWVFETWWTEETGRTNEQGIFQTQAYFGGYEIIVEYGEESDTINLEFDKQTDTITVQSGNLFTATHASQNDLLSFQLEGNYPNPFSNNTWIHYILPKPTYVRLKIYSLNGQFVTDLVSDNQPAGRYHIPFKAFLLPEGIYVAHLSTEHDHATIKMILQR